VPHTLAVLVEPARRDVRVLSTRYRHAVPQARRRLALGVLIVLAAASAATYVYRLVQLFPGTASGNRQDFLVVALLGSVGVGYVVYMALQSRSVILGLLFPCEFLLFGGVGFPLLRSLKGGRLYWGALLLMVILGLALLSWVKLEVIMTKLRRWTGLS
jgi:hypothetical protein